MNSTTADNIVGEWADTLIPDSDEHRDLDTALYQHARLWGGRDHTFDSRMRPLALLDSVERLRGWQRNGDAPDEVKEAMGVLSHTLRDRLGRLYNADLIAEVERLREEVAAHTT